MSATSLTMSEVIPSTHQQPGFLRRLFMLILFIAGIVTWMSLLQRYQVTLPQLTMTIFADLMVALAAGLGTRLIFYQQTHLTRLLIALPVLLLAFWGLGFFTGWQSGIGPIRTNQNPLEAFDYVQLLAGVGVVLISLRAWWRPAEPPMVESLADPLPSSLSMHESDPSHQPGSRPHFSLPSFRTNTRTTRSSRSTRSKRNGQLRTSQNTRSRSSRSRRTAASAPPVERMVISKPIKATRAKRQRIGPKKPELQLSVYEEHRCPYCLEEVTRNDPRGVKECSICHTLHHADCWNVTGMCQIPHLNSLNL